VLSDKELLGSTTEARNVGSSILANGQLIIA